MNRIMYRCSTTAIRHSLLPYPYSYTFRTQEVKNPCEDVRFMMYQATQSLNKFEGEHVNTVFQAFLNELMSSRHNHINFVDAKLQEKMKLLKNIMKSQNMSLTLNPIQNKQLSRSGFLRIEGIDYPCKKEIHELEMVRDSQVLKCSDRQLPSGSKDLDEQLIQDISKGFVDKSKDIEELKKNLRGEIKLPTGIQAIKDAVVWAGDKLSGSKDNKTGFSLKRIFEKQAKKYIQVDQIDMDVEYSVMKSSKIVEEGKVLFQTKWLYAVDQKEAQSILKNKKRVLFEVENWMKGSFIPVRQFYSRHDSIQ